MTIPLGEPAMRAIDKNLVLIFKQLAALDETTLALSEHSETRDKLLATTIRRVDTLVDRVDRVYTKMHALERKLREMNTS